MQFYIIYQWLNIHCLLSFLITSLHQNFPYFASNRLKPPVLNCLYCILLPPAGLIVVAMVGKSLGDRFLAAVNNCLPDSWFPHFEPKFLNLPRLFSGDVLLNCFVALVFMLLPGGGFPRIWADGLILSSHRRIQFPRFLPISISLSWILRCTLSAISNTTRVRLIFGAIFTC